jgi:hypothetical protein
LLVFNLNYDALVIYLKCKKPARGAMFIEVFMSYYENDDNAKIAGATAGVTTAGGIGALAAGASAAEITTMLYTAGTLVGGGMATGVAVVAAAPLAAAGVVYGAWKLFTD